MTCEARNQCGFFQWMTKERGLSANSFCPIDTQDCQRLNPAIVQITMTQMGPATHREMNIGFPKGQILFRDMSQAAQNNS